ncbi:MAG: phosphomethylpyrimidine synthase ThiC [Candidatus Omnitrophota bacterium]
MTQLEEARNNKINSTLCRIAKKEGVSSLALLKNIKSGRTVILKNNSRFLKSPCAVGRGVSTKINANIGTSTDKFNIKNELKKIDICIKYGADTIMDLSVGGNIKKMRAEVLGYSPIPVGTVPVYELAVSAQKRGNLLNFDYIDMLEVLESQAKEGVDFFTIHAGVTKKSISALKKSKRVLNIVSRGGGILASWVKKHKKENPFFEYFDKILDIAYKYDVVLSLGDGMRPGSILDANDSAQFTELKILGELALRARRRNVQVMIEGPGHVPLNLIKKNIEMQKKFCYGAPFYVLGPLVTDIASGYDHISASIGGAIAAGFGADFLCYVTPAEHLRHPSLSDVKEGIIASKIAAHAADIVKKNKRAINLNRQISLARRDRNWANQIKLSIDPDKAKEYRSSSKPLDEEVCTMCGGYCPVKLAGVVHR